MSLDHSVNESAFLETLCEKRSKVAVYLTNGIKLQGCIGSHDRATVVLDEPIKQLIYKHAISSIMPILPKMDKPLDNK